MTPPLPLAAAEVDSPENLLFNNCYLHYITELVAQISSILGDSTAARHAHPASGITRNFY